MDRTTLGITAVSVRHNQSQTTHLAMGSVAQKHSKGGKSSPPGMICKEPHRMRPDTRPPALIRPLTRDPFHALVTFSEARLYGRADGGYIVRHGYPDGIILHTCNDKLRTTLTTDIGSQHRYDGYRHCFMFPDLIHLFMLHMSMTGVDAS